MKRKDFKQIIKLRSCWRIDKRKGNYKLPSGNKLSDYIENLVVSQMEIDNLLIRENGDLCCGYGGNWNTDTKDFNDYTLIPDFVDNETCTYDDMESRIKKLVFEIIS